MSGPGSTAGPARARPRERRHVTGRWRGGRGQAEPEDLEAAAPGQAGRRGHGGWRRGGARERGSREAAARARGSAQLRGEESVSRAARAVLLGDLLGRFSPAATARLLSALERSELTSHFSPAIQHSVTVLSSELPSHFSPADTAGRRSALGRAVVPLLAGRDGVLSPCSWASCWAARRTTVARLRAAEPRLAPHHCVPLSARLQASSQAAVTPRHHSWSILQKKGGKQ